MFAKAQARVSRFAQAGTTVRVAITSEATGQNAIGISSSGGGPSNCAQQTSNNASCVAGFPKPSWQTVTFLVSRAFATRRTSRSWRPPISLGTFSVRSCQSLVTAGTGSACGTGGAAGITNALRQPTPPIIGGTSASAPIFAGMIALMNQYLIVDGDITTPGLGNVNPKLYQVAANSSNGAFNKVNLGDNNVYCSPNTPAGYA